MKAEHQLAHEHVCLYNTHLIPEYLIRHYCLSKLLVPCYSAVQELQLKLDLFSFGFLLALCLPVSDRVRRLLAVASAEGVQESISA